MTKKSSLLLEGRHSYASFQPVEKTSQFLGKCSVDCIGGSCLHLHLLRVYTGRNLKHSECFQRKKPQNFWWRLGFMKSWNCSWFLPEKDVYPAPSILGTFKASVRVAHRNLAVFKEVCSKLQNHLGFTMSQASHFYFHFISICARNRASCNKSLLRE